MKFTIRFADKIVGTLVLLGLVVLIAVIFLLGRSQRWFMTDIQYRTYFPSASGLSVNMPIQYKGFTIGYVKNISLAENDRVEIRFSIFDEHGSRVRQGSLVEINIIPLGLGSSFILHPGLGEELLPEGSLIPERNSPEAISVFASGLATVSDSSDSLAIILDQVTSILNSVDVALAGSEGARNITLGQILLNLEETTAGLTGIGGLTDEINPILEQVNLIFEQINPIIGQINPIIDQFNPIIQNIQTMTDQLADPSGTVMSALDGEGPLFTNIIDLIASLAGIIDNLDKTTEFIPAQLPQIGVLISELNVTLKNAQDVLVALANNPLLRGGVPERKEAGPGGANPRNLDF